MQVFLHPSDQPVFRLQGSAAQCCVVVKINDVPVHRHESGLAHDFDLAINEWLFQGANHVEVVLGPPEQGQDMSRGSSFEWRLLHRISGDVVRSTAELGRLAWSPDPIETVEHQHHMHNPEPSSGLHALPEGHEDSAPLLALPGQTEEVEWKLASPVLLPDKRVRITSTVSLPPPWPVCPWSGGALLEAQAGINHAASSLLRNLHHTLRHGGWREVMGRKMSAIQTAYYLSGDEVDDALGFPALLSRPDWALSPLPDNGLAVEYAGNGRLVRLLNSASGSSPLVLVNKNIGVCGEIDVWWMFKNEWALIR